MTSANMKGKTSDIMTVVGWTFEIYICILSCPVYLRKAKAKG